MHKEVKRQIIVELTALALFILFSYWLSTHPYIDKNRFKNTTIGGYSFFFAENCMSGRNITGLTCGGWTDQKGNIWIVMNTLERVYKVCIHEIAHNELDLDTVKDYPNTVEELFIRENMDTKDIYEPTCIRLINKLSAYGVPGN